MRFDGLRVVIYSNDHRPAHVHIIGANGEAVFELNCPDGPLTLRDVYGFNQRQCAGMKEELTAAIAALCRNWSEIHDRE